MAQFPDDYEALPQAPRERAVQSLYQLAAIETLVDSKIKILHADIQRLYEGLNPDLVGSGNGEVVRVSDMEVDESGVSLWRVFFRSQDILMFHCHHGFQPSPRPVIASCDVLQGIRDHPLVATLHLTKHNGGAQWEVVNRSPLKTPGQPPQPLTDEFLLKLLTQYADEAIKRYTSG